MTASRPAALFDFDKTLLRGESLSLFLRYVAGRFRRVLLDLPRLGLWMAPYAVGATSKEQMKTRAFRMLRLVPDKERPDLVAAFLDEILKPRIFAAGREMLRRHREQGHTLVLASASCDVYMEPVRRLLGFDVLVSTRTRPTGPNGAPVVVGANCYGQEKVRRLAELDFFENTDWTGSYAYSDHPSDLPMLLLCGHPVAANPNRSLRRMAKREGWEIADWR
jgi:HAD superfamily hydrolase (TIGR01490 family)